MTTKSEIQSLVYLLDDPDPFVKSEVEKRLFHLGEQAVPLLDEERSKSRDSRERELINDIIQSITFGSLEEDFVDVLDKGLDNLIALEEAVLLLSRLENPTLRECDYKRRLDQLADRIRDDLRYELDDSKKMHILLDYVFDELNFTPGSTDYYNPDNIYMDRVLDRRTGLPVSLGLVVLFLARRLDLPFYGVNMPVHFMLTYKGEKEEVLVDPFDSGNSVTYNQCYYFLKQNGIEPKKEHFEIAKGHEILSRCIRNLIKCYSKKEKDQQVSKLKNLLETVEMMQF